MIKSSQTSKSNHFSFLGTLNPSPIRRELIPILKLLETEAMMNIAHSSGPYKDQKINVTNIAKVMVPAYNNYCAQMPGTNCHLGCDRLLNLQHSGRLHTLALQSFPFNEHAVYCADDDFCLYFAKGNYKSNNCRILCKKIWLRYGD